MKKLLFITAFPPSRFTAGQNYTLNLLEDLSSRYTIDLVYFRYQHEKYSSHNPNINVIAALPLSPWNRMVNFLRLPFIHPIFSSRFNPKLLKELKQRVEEQQYVKIYFDFSQVFIYNYFIRHADKVLMSHDVIAQKYSRKGFSIERRWIDFSERRLFAEATVIQTFSAKDQTLLRQLYDRDSEIVHFYLSPKILDLDLQSFRQEDYFCFFGAWNRPENSDGLKWFLEHVFPYTGNAKFVVVGGSLPGSIATAIEAEARMKYVGFVDDPYVVIARAKALIAPLFQGAGIKVKVIESLCCGTPVLGTGIAIEGIPDIAGNIIRCESALEFTAAILSFDIPQERKPAFRNFFLKYYNQVQKTTL